MGFPSGSAGKESACNAGDLSLISWLGRSPGEGNGYPLQYSGLEKMDCIIHGVTKCRTRLHFHFVKNKVPIGAWVYFWAFYLVSLVYISVFVPVPYWLDDCK